MRARAVDKDGRPVVTERMLQELVRKTAISLGYKYYHTWNSMHSAAGFPDCVLLKSGRLIFVELKSAKGKLSLEQQEWLNGLNTVAVSVEVYVVRPEDFDGFYEKLRCPGL